MEKKNNDVQLEMFIDDVCDGEQTWNLYLGIQKGFKHIPDFALYNCQECGTTKAYPLKNYEPTKIGEGKWNQ